MPAKTPLIVPATAHPRQRKLWKREGHNFVRGIARAIMNSAKIARAANSRRNHLLAVAAPAYFFGSANAVIVSEVGGSAAKGLPVAFTTTYCRPSLPSYVLGTEPAAASSL